MTSSYSALRVLITGAAGQIGYILAAKVARGEMFGPNQHVILHLLEIPPAQKALEGLVMELQDLAAPLLDGVVASTSDIQLVFQDIDIALLVGAFPRQIGMTRSDLLSKNLSIFTVHGKALNDYASRNVKVVVVGNPANTNALVAMQSAPDLPPQNFSALTRLDQNRAISLFASHLKVPLGQVSNVIVWGNHSGTQFPDVSHALVNGAPAVGLGDHAFLTGDFITTVQNRGAAIIKARGASSAISAAQAICDHMNSWICGTPEGVHVSMGVLSDGTYCPEGVIYSVPVTCKGGQWTLVRDLPIDTFSRTKMDASYDELKEEATTAASLLEERAAAKTE